MRACGTAAVIAPAAAIITDHRKAEPDSTLSSSWKKPATRTATDRTMMVAVAANFMRASIVEWWKLKRRTPRRGAVEGFRNQKTKTVALAFRFHWAGGRRSLREDGSVTEWSI